MYNVGDINAVLLHEIKITRNTNSDRCERRSSKDESTRKHHSILALFTFIHNLQAKTFLKCQKSSLEETSVNTEYIKYYQQYSKILTGPVGSAIFDFSKF